jgi:hypothetical protein
MDPRDLMFCLTVFTIVDKVKPSDSIDALKQCVEAIAQKTETPTMNTPNVPAK